MLNKSGVTLVEMMIALVVLLFVSLALMQTTLVSIDSNMRNLLRNEAVSVAEQLIDDTRNTPYTDATMVDTAGVYTDRGAQNRSVRNVAMSYSRVRRIIDHGADNKEVRVTIGWTWKGTQYNYNFSTVIRNPS